MLNQTFTVLFESLFINELGQAGEGKVWFKTKPIEEWIAENTPPISEQPISFMDFEPGTTVFPVVITGIVVLPNGQVTINTPNGTFLADTTLIPRPVLKPTVIEDKNGNQFIVHPDGTVTSLGQAGFIPKPMTTEEKLDKIRRGLYLEALKDYKTQIETYYTSKNQPIPTRGPRNHNKNIIIDLPECIGTEANEIKSTFLAINDNVNKKELRENSLKRILGTSKKTTLDALAQTALTNLSARVKITESEFKQFLSTLQFKTEKDSVCGEWSINYEPLMSVYLYPTKIYDTSGLSDKNFTLAEFNTTAVYIQNIFQNLPVKIFVVYEQKSELELINLANADKANCYLRVFQQPTDYGVGDTDMLNVNESNSLRASVSYAITDRGLADDVKLYACSFVTAHEAWHQMLEKALNYLVLSNDNLVSGNGFSERTQNAHNLVYDDSKDPHFDKSVPNLNMSKSKLQTYGGVNNVYLYKGSTDIELKNKEKQCLDILPIQKAYFLLFMRKTSKIR